MYFLNNHNLLNFQPIYKRFGLLQTLLWYCTYFRTLFYFSLFYQKYAAECIVKPLVFRYFSRYSVKVRKSSIVTDNTTRNEIMIIQLEQQETWNLKDVSLLLPLKFS
jgi:hypothetical protein